MWQQFNWIRNPFLVDAKNSSEALSLQIRQEFIELRNDGMIKLSFAEMPLDDFYISVKKENPEISNKAVSVAPIFYEISMRKSCIKCFSIFIPDTFKIAIQYNVFTVVKANTLL